MPTTLDLVYVAAFAVALPLLDYLFFWPAFRRRSQLDPARARRRLWVWAVVASWPVVAVGTALWMQQGRSWASFGFTLPDGWRLWSSIAFCLLVTVYFGSAIASVTRSAEARAGIRQQVGTMTAMLPRTRTDMLWFAAVALTAGFCEEFLYRGYFIHVFATWLGWWGAAALSVAVFATWHAYQGWGGVLRTGIAGVIYTLIVPLSQSLWPAIFVHALVDLANGMMAWVALREVSPAGDVPAGAGVVESG